MSASTRPRRTTAVARAGANWPKYWAAFEATETDDGGDGAQDCAAQLLYRADGAGAPLVCPGSTGKGHAEMNALDEFIKHVCRLDLEEMRKIFRRGTKRDADGNEKKDPAKVLVLCTAKPCCVRCSAVLGALEIGPAPGTFKTMKKMGKTEWGGLSKPVRELVCDYLGIPRDSFADLAR